MRLAESDYSGDTLTVAQRLLGCLFVRYCDGQRMSGIIVETEAYLPANDPASHSFGGQKRRNLAMYQAPGTLYVYAIHAKYCMNVVTEPVGVGAAVLIRALQPLEGVTTMQTNRPADKLRDLCTGPARLCQALAITTAHDQTDLLRSDCMWIEPAPDMVTKTDWTSTSSPRIGISVAQELHYRYFIDGHACVSGLARLHRSKRDWIFGQPRTN